MHKVDTGGASIPALGLGTWQLSGDGCRAIVGKALEVGYRHIDTAQAYGNEAAVGQAIRESRLTRDEVFLTTKIWPDHFRRDDLKANAKARLDTLKLDYIDLLLLHWPSPDIPIQETIEALNEVVDAGQTRFIGVSNFNVPMIEAATTVTRAPLVTNQVEYHPLLSQDKLLKWLRAEYVSLTAYCPLARGKVMDRPVLQELAERHGKTPAQVTLRWLVQQDNVIAIPRSSSEKRVEENFDIWDFTLDDSEMKAVSAIGSPGGRLVDLEGYSPAWD